MASNPIQLIKSTAPFTIVKGVPVPAHNGNGKGTLYPFAQMEIGDSFDAPRDMGKGKGGNCNRQNVIIACARAYAKKYNPSAKFTTRLIDADTVRCWRVA